MINPKQDSLLSDGWHQVAPASREAMLFMKPLGGRVGGFYQLLAAES